MYTKIQKIIPALLAISSYAIDTHFRTGVDFSSISFDINSDIVSSFIQSRPYAVPHFTAEIRKSIDDSVSFGLSGSYTPIMIRKQSYHALRVGMASYLKYGHHNLLGLGLHVHHVPLNTFAPVITGYLNNLSLGIIMQGTITENIYSHFEIRQDITPTGFKSWEFTPSNDHPVGLLSSMVTLKYFTGSVSVGYALPTES